MNDRNTPNVQNFADLAKAIQRDTAPEVRKPTHRSPAGSRPKQSHAVSLSHFLSSRWGWT